MTDAGNLGANFKAVVGTPAITITDDGNATTAVLPSGPATAFNGDSQPNLLLGTDGVLGLGDKVKAVFTVTVDPNAGGGTGNTAVASGKDPSGAATSDDSGGADGGAGSATPLPTTPAYAPKLDTTKSFDEASIVPFSDGTFTIDVTIDLLNSGNVDLDNLQLTDKLDAPTNMGTFFLSVEGRAFKAVDAGFTETGVLAAAYRNLGDNAQVGVGYNFGTFSDDLTDLTLDEDGVFVNLVAKF